MSQRPVDESELHAYVDGVLGEARRGEVAAWLAEHAEEAARVRAYQAQKAALRALFDPVLAEAVPERLLSPSVAVDAQKGPIFGRWSLQRLAAGVLIGLLGAAGGWLAHGQYAAGERFAHAVPLPHQAAVAHVVFTPDARRPVEVTAAQEDQLVAWLSKRLGTPVRPPKLGGLGYELVGGRLLPGNSGPVAQFMYQDAGGQRLTLLVTTENVDARDTAFRFAQEGKVNVFYWVDGQFGYALSGGIARSDLAGVAMAVHQQLGRP